MTVFSILLFKFTGLFLSPSETSQFFSVLTKTDTAQRSILTYKEPLQICVLLYIITSDVAGDATDLNPVVQFLPHTWQYLMIDTSDCVHDSLSELGKSKNGA